MSSEERDHDQCLTEEVAKGDWFATIVAIDHGWDDSKFDLTNDEIRDTLLHLMLVGYITPGVHGSYALTEAGIRYMNLSPKDRRQFKTIRWF